MTITGLPVSTNHPIGNIDISLAVLSKSLDTIEQSGQNLLKMMEQSVQPNLGQSIDLKI